MGSYWSLDKLRSDHTVMADRDWLVVRVLQLLKKTTERLNSSHPFKESFSNKMIGKDTYF